MRRRLALSGGLAVVVGLTVVGCQGFVLNPHGEDPSIDNGFAPGTPVGAGGTAAGPAPGAGVDAPVVITPGPSAPGVPGAPDEVAPGSPMSGTPPVPTVGPADPAAPIFDDDAGAPAPERDSGEASTTLTKMSSAGANAQGCENDASCSDAGTENE